jgi:hypothetical protein
MVRTLGAALALAACSAIASMPAMAQQSSPPGQYVVTYVETIPAKAAAGEEALQRYVAYANRQPGVVLFQLEKEAGFTNRYAIWQEWQTAGDYTNFVNASQGWTQYLNPYLDAPFDNRLGNYVQ